MHYFSFGRGLKESILCIIGECKFFIEGEKYGVSMCKTTNKFLQFYEVSLCLFS